MFGSRKAHFTRNEKLIIESSLQTITEILSALDSSIVSLGASLDLLNERVQGLENTINPPEGSQS